MMYSPVLLIGRQRLARPSGGELAGRVNESEQEMLEMTQKLHLNDDEFLPMENILRTGGKLKK